jgi:hypothetical protein
MRSGESGIRLGRNAYKRSDAGIDILGSIRLGRDPDRNGPYRSCRKCGISLDRDPNRNDCDVALREPTGTERRKSKRHLF